MEKGMTLNLQKILKELRPYRERKAVIDPKHAALLAIDMQNYFHSILKPVLGNV
jgi:isochorismate hydrolase